MHLNSSATPFFMCACFHFRCSGNMQVSVCPAELYLKENKSSEVEKFFFSCAWRWRENFSIACARCVKSSWEAVCLSESFKHEYIQIKANMSVKVLDRPGRFEVEPVESELFVISKRPHKLLGTVRTPPELVMSTGRLQLLLIISEVTSAFLPFLHQQLCKVYTNN